MWLFLDAVMIEKRLKMKVADKKIGTSAKSRMHTLCSWSSQRFESNFYLNSQCNSIGVYKITTAIYLTNEEKSR